MYKFLSQAATNLKFIHILTIEKSRNISTQSSSCATIKPQLKWRSENILWMCIITVDQKHILFEITTHFINWKCYKYTRIEHVVVSQLKPSWIEVVSGKYHECELKLYRYSAAVQEIVSDTTCWKFLQTTSTKIESQLNSGWSDVVSGTYH